MPSSYAFLSCLLSFNPPSPSTSAASPLPLRDYKSLLHFSSTPKKYSEKLNSWVDLRRKVAKYIEAEQSSRRGDFYSRRRAKCFWKFLLLRCVRNAQIVVLTLYFYRLRLIFVWNMKHRRTHAHAQRSNKKDVNLTRNCIIVGKWYMFESDIYQCLYLIPA